MSRPAWGAWIEILLWKMESIERRSRPAWGAWIEITSGAIANLLGSSRAPHGARGLKFGWEAVIVYQCVSRPAWGAWIEI